ncbi:hypothetical protein BKA70DRAFT_768892 [Coprinopsis sp. MPI-PUGE-AT-0042]|nr:hypothetical protein BKA70DRAFT_768892 [Coprinopsis sp. MPI-PUGE-AT-0042]
MFLASLLWVYCSIAAVHSKILWDGRAPKDYTSAQLDASKDPYLTAVKGPSPASNYTQLLGRDVAPTRLWNKNILEHIPLPLVPAEQALRITISNTSVFKPGSNAPQTGFRRTELIAQQNGSASGLTPIIGSGKVAFHFSLRADERRRLDLKHEHQLVFVEPSDGSHVFGLQLGSPFTNPTESLPARKAEYLKVLNHDLDVVFEAKFKDDAWHNFAVIVDWDKKTLQAFYSQDQHTLVPVSKVVPNLTAKDGAAGRGEFHFGLLKLPIVNPADPPEVRGDVVHYGLQPPTVHGLFYSGVFIEDLIDGLSVGGSKELRI